MRKPEIIDPKRMQSLDILPLFHKLKAQKVIVAGEGEGAFWKAELVAAAGANVIFYCNQSTLRHADFDNIKYVEKPWQEGDFSNARIAILQSNSDDEAQEFIQKARISGASVNIIDRPEYCDFQFGAIVNRSPLVIGVSTDGASPALGQQIRAKFETMFPQKIVNWLKLAQKLRPIIKSKQLDFNTRRSFWHKFASLSLENPGQTPNETEIFGILDNEKPIIGMVSLVGAGPGDPELLTLKAIRALGRADIIMFDDLVEKEILDFARREAQLINVGKRGGKPSVPQNEICQMLVDFAKQGKNIVRIKGGDALIFGRAMEEIKACKDNDIAIELIPGISASQGAAAALGLSLTDRNYSKRVQFVTGHSAKGDLPDDINWGAIAANDVTTFIYMPRKTIADFVNMAIKAGINIDMPSAIIINATRENQKIVYCKFNELPHKFENLIADGPEMVMIGNILKNNGN